MSLFGAGLPLQVIGGRGATGMGPQKNDFPMFSGSFSRSDFGHVFGRPSVAKRLQIGGQNGGRNMEKREMKHERDAVTVLYRFLINCGGP